MRLERDDAYGSTGIIPDTGEELGKSHYRLNQYPLDARGNVAQEREFKTEFFINSSQFGGIKDQEPKWHDVEKAAKE